ncbi:2178_t:CDS:2, partial [Gigaspora rosea]
MKISNYLIFSFVTFFILVILSSGLTQDSVIYSTFTYPEITNQSNLTGNPPRILHFDHYNDNSGTAVARIARVNYYDYATKNYCYEQRLLLRVIQKNGSVIEINYEDATEIQDINYCYISSAVKNPLNFYPLFDQYILVTYTHATNTSDTTTYTDRGMVFDWGGNILSKLEFGSSYLFPGTNWYPDEFVINNITPKNGFLRLSAINGIGTDPDSFKWSQYGHHGNGVFYLLTNNTVPRVLNSGSFQVTVFATLNYGYAIVYANTTNNSSPSDPLSAQLTAKAGIYAILLSYNQTSTSRQTILYEMTSPNLTFSTLFCSVDYVFIGHTCIISAQQSISIPANATITYYPNLTTTTLVSTTTTAAVPILNTPVNITIVDNTVPPNITQKSFDIKIRFLSTGSVISLNPIFNVTSNMIKIRTLPLGGYTYISQQPNGQIINFTFDIYNEVDQLYTNWTFPQFPIISNIFGAFDVLQNNTILVALNGSITTWSFYAIDLPKLAPQIGTFLNLKVLTSTFNDPGGQYSIEIDNNFVKSSDYNEPILGIDPNIWNFQTNNSIPRNQKRTGDVRGKLRLTPSGTFYFLSLNDSGKNEFFTGLINELLVIIPTEQGRLDSSRLHQNDPSSTDKLLISLIVYKMKNGDKKNATAIQNDLDQLIKNRDVTGISLFGNKTSLLDKEYGFQPS